MIHALLLLAAQSPAVVFQQAAVAGDALQASTLRCRADGHTEISMSGGTFTIEFVKPDKARLRKGPFLYILNGSRLFIVNGDEYVAKNVTGRSVAEKLTLFMGELDHPALLLLDSGYRHRWFRNMAAYKDWTSSRDVGGLHFRRRDITKRPVMDIELTFSPKTRRMSAILFETEPLGFGTSMDPGEAYGSIHFAYDPPPDVARFSPPEGTKQVREFSTIIREADYETDGAARIVHSSIAAYRALKRLRYQVTENGETATVAWKPGAALQRQAAVTWAYNAGLLTVQNTAQRKFYRGKASSRHVGSELEQAGGSVDPTLHYLLEGNNPVEVLLDPFVHVRVSGSVLIGGVVCDVVELQSPGRRISLHLRRSDHLIADTLTEVLEPGGHVLSTSQRVFNYKAANQNPSDWQFVLPKPPGWKTVSLSAP